MSMLRLARVAAVHPEDHSVDLVMVDDGSRFAGAPVVSATAGTDSGVFDMPDLDPMRDRWSVTERRDRDMLAIVSMLAGNGGPVVLGFLYPQVNGMLFADRNRRVVRHVSDVYTTVDGDGNLEVYHPSGTSLRIATDPEHEDLTGRDFDGNWKITKNTDKQVHLKVVVKSGGAEKASLHIDPSGNVSLECVGNLAVEVGGTADVKVTGTARVESPAVTIDAPQTTCTGALTVQGLLTYQAGLVGSGGSGASLTGNLTVSGNVATTGTLQNNGKNVGSTHQHGGVQSGGSVSGVPL